jgi:hypothetical protein
VSGTPLFDRYDSAPEHGVRAPEDCPIPGAKEIRFNGEDYVPQHDLARLTGQICRVFDCMADGAWRTLDEIAQATGDPQASVSAQLRHLRKPRFGQHRVEKRARGERSHGLFEYRVIVRVED